MTHETELEPITQSTIETLQKVNTAPEAIKPSHGVDNELLQTLDKPGEARIAIRTVLQVTHAPSTKRVVPRSLYMRIQAWKAGLRLSGFLYHVLGTLCAALALFFLYSLVTSLMFSPGAISWEGVGVVVLSSLIGIVVAIMEIRNCKESGADRLAQAKRIAPVTPLTRANTAHLPASESLVRPSSEADRATKDMLRPASVHEAIPAPHMLRPVVAQPDILPVEQLIRPASSPREAS